MRAVWHPRFPAARKFIPAGQIAALPSRPALPNSRTPRKSWKSCGRNQIGKAGRQDRKSVVQGKSVAVRVDFGGRRIIKKKTGTVIIINETLILITILSTIKLQSIHNVHQLIYTPHIV